MAQTTATPQVQHQQRRTNTMSILSLVFAFVFWPLGIAFGVVARKQISRTGEAGDGLAKAGLILGVIFGVLAVIYCIFLFLVIVPAMNG